jgi:hypothetical protein
MYGARLVLVKSVLLFDGVLDRSTMDDRSQRTDVTAGAWRRPLEISWRTASRSPSRVSGSASAGYSSAFFRTQRWLIADGLAEQQDGAAARIGLAADDEDLVGRAPPSVHGAALASSSGTP